MRQNRKKWDGRFFYLGFVSLFEDITQPGYPRPPLWRTKVLLYFYQREKLAEVNAHPSNWGGQLRSINPLWWDSRKHTIPISSQAATVPDILETKFRHNIKAKSHRLMFRLLQHFSFVLPVLSFFHTGLSLMWGSFIKSCKGGCCRDFELVAGCSSCLLAREVVESYLQCRK